MDAKTYLKISAINLGFMFVGLSIGVALMSGLVAVHAQPTKDTPPAKVAPSAPAPVTM